MTIRLKDKLTSWSDRLFDQVDAGSRVVFRGLFGIVMLWEAYRYFGNG